MADADPEESPAQKQARIRREKREKKILAGGSDRLAKITNVSGRPAEPAPPSTLNPTATPDPDESDIGSFSFPSTQNQQQPGIPSDADLRAFLRGADPSQQTPGQDGEQGQEPDMMAMLQQLMGGAPPGGGMPGQPPFGAPGGGPGGAGGAGGPGAGPDMSGLPPALASLLSGGMGGAPPPQAPGASRAYIWKILHAASAFALALYILVTYPFAGTLAARSLDPAKYSVTPEEAAGAATGGATNIFYVFATTQLVLQSSRFFLERGAEETGMVAKIAGFLPPPWGDRVKLVARYGGIWTTLVADAMCVVFVLGVVAWWRGVGA